MATAITTGYMSIFKDLEPKTRIFLIKNSKSTNGLRYILQSKHTGRKPLTYFDGKINRALRWATNQISPFLDEQDGYATVEPIIFENGKLIVDATNINLQKFLMLHPKFENVFHLFDKEKVVKDEYKTLEEQLDAQIKIKELPIEELESVARVALKSQGVNPSDMTSTELRRDMLIWAKRNPAELENILGDENIQLRNLAVRAVEQNILFIKPDQRTVVWAADKRQKVLVAPYGENVYTALAEHFKTDNGLDDMQKISNLL